LAGLKRKKEEWDVFVVRGGYQTGPNGAIWRLVQILARFSDEKNRVEPALPEFWRGKRRVEPAQPEFSIKNIVNESTHSEF